MSRRRNNRTETALYKKINNWISANPNVAQFWGSILASLITLAALIITIFFSLSALKESHTQNLNASQQLILAKEQFQYAKKLHTQDSLISVKNDFMANERFKEDTTKQLKREKLQEVRNKIQDAANKQQLNLNAGQLLALQAQAKTSNELFLQQKDQYRQQLYEQRPIFYIDSLDITKITDVRSTIMFFFSNKGIRPAHVDSVALAFFNPLYLCFSVTKLNSNLDLLPTKNSLITSKINIYNDCLNNNQTVYYLLIYYKDNISGQSHIEPIYFQYTYTKQKQFTWNRYFGSSRAEFSKRLKTKGIFVLD